MECPPERLQLGLFGIFPRFVVRRSAATTSLRIAKICSKIPNLQLFQADAPRVSRRERSKYVRKSLCLNRFGRLSPGIPWSARQKGVYRCGYKLKQANKGGEQELWHAPPLINRARLNRILPSVTSKIRRADFPERREGGMG